MPIKKKTNKIYPLAYLTEGGMTIGYTPSSEERRKCGYAPRDYSCDDARTAIVKRESLPFSCSDCKYHPQSRFYKKR